jgi:hypothetical protein
MKKKVLFIRKEEWEWEWEWDNRVEYFPTN